MDLSFYPIKFVICLFQATNVEAEASGIHDGDYQLIKHEYSNLGRGKYSGNCIFTVPYSIHRKYNVQIGL